MTILVVQEKVKNSVDICILFVNKNIGFFISNWGVAPYGYLYQNIV